MVLESFVAQQVLVFVRQAHSNEGSVADIAGAIGNISISLDRIADSLDGIAKA